MKDSASTWWEGTPAAKQFLQKAAETLLGNQQVILHIPQMTPWKSVMNEMLEEYLQDHSSGHRSLKIVNAADIGSTEDDLGQYLLENFCKEELRYRYRPGRGYAKFLSQCEESTLRDVWLFVYDVTQNQLANWLPFLQAYSNGLQNREGCLFLLETTDDLLATSKNIQDIIYQRDITRYDCFVFYSIFVAASSVQQDYREYLSELVIQIAKDDIELGAKCIEQGKDFLVQPLQVLQNIQKQSYRSDGTAFIIPKKAELEYSLWLAQLKQIFPKIETYRHDFLSRYAKDIMKNLPIQNIYHEWVENVSDVEIGLLYYFVTRKLLFLDELEYKKLQSFYHARNILAHMKYLPFVNIKPILTSAN